MKDGLLFISHASHDGDIVNRIVSYLEGQGVSCWIASRDIPARSIYAEEIAKSIQQCSACAVVVSAAANASKAVMRELELASHYDKPFIPIRVDSSEPGTGLDYYLRNAQWVDFHRQGEPALDRIAARRPSTSADLISTALHGAAWSQSRASRPRMMLMLGGGVIFAAAALAWLFSTVFSAVRWTSPVSPVEAPIQEVAADAPGYPEVHPTLVATPNSSFTAIDPTEVGIFGARSVMQAIEASIGGPDMTQGSTVSVSVRENGDAAIADVVRYGIVDESVSAGHLRIEFRHEADGWYPTNAYRRTQCARGGEAGQWTAGLCP